MDRLKIYAEVAFLDRFFNKLNADSPRNKVFLHNLMNLALLLESRVDLIIDSTPDEFLKKSEKSPDYYELRDKHQRNQLDISFVKSIDVNEDTVSGEELFLLNCSDEEMSKMAIKFETVFCNIESSEVCLRRLFLERSIPLKKNQTLPEEFYKDVSFDLMISSNIVFNDNYILGNSSKREGIINWCSNLPLSASFNVTVMSGEAEAKKLGEHLRKIRKKLETYGNIETEIIRKAIHHRYLLTDTYFIHSDQSLHFFKNGCCEFNDTVTIKTKYFPKTDHKSLSGFEQYSYIREILIEEYKKGKRTESLEPLTAGNCNNRILNRP